MLRTTVPGSTGSRADVFPDSSWTPFFGGSVGSLGSGIIGGFLIGRVVGLVVGGGGRGGS